MKETRKQRADLRRRLEGQFGGTNGTGQGLESVSRVIRAIAGGSGPYQYDPTRSSADEYLAALHRRQAEQQKSPIEGRIRRIQLLLRD